MEKKLYLLTSLLVGLLILSTAQAQDSIVPQTASQNMLAANNSDVETITRLQKQIEDLSRELKSNTNDINMLMASKDLDAQNRYLVIRQNLENATTAYKLLHTKMQGMKSYQSNRLFEPFVKELANPESDRLGFRFDQKVTSLVEENVKPKKRSIASRIHEGVNAIATNQVVSLIPVVSPAAQLTNNVMGFLRSTSVMTDDVDQATIAKMESELNNYIHFYNLLAEANKEFEYNLNAQRQELNLLQRNFYDQVRYFADKAGLEAEARGNQEDVQEYLNRLFLTLDQNYMSNRLTQFEQRNKSGNRVNYDQLLLSEGANDLKDANNRLEEFVGIINQLEFQYNKHYRYTDLYAEKIKSALDEAATLGITEDNICKQLKKEVDEMRDRTNNDFRNAINMDELTKAKKSIRYTARII